MLMNDLPFFDALRVKGHGVEERCQGSPDITNISFYFKQKYRIKYRLQVFFLYIYLRSQTDV